MRVHFSRNYLEIEKNARGILQITFERIRHIFRSCLNRCDITKLEKLFECSAFGQIRFTEQ